MEIIIERDYDAVCERSASIVKDACSRCQHSYNPKE